MSVSVTDMQINAKNKVCQTHERPGAPNQDKNSTFALSHDSVRPEHRSMMHFFFPSFAVSHASCCEIAVANKRPEKVQELSHQNLAANCCCF